MTKRRALEILRDHWGHRRPLTDEVRAEIDAENFVEPKFSRLARIAELPILQGVRECTRDIDEIDPTRLGAHWDCHDWVRRAAENMLSQLPEEERKAKLRDEFANGTWSTTEPFTPNDHENEPVPYAPPKFEGSV